MRPSIALASHRTYVLESAARYQTTNVRLFGSAVQGNDTDTSDLDILADPLPHTTLFDLSGLQVELEQMLGVKVDVLTPLDLPVKFRADVLATGRLI
jgi:uncharacterized protein